jgi:hypothetical protein
MQEIYMLCPLHNESGVCVRNESGVCVRNESGVCVHNESGVCVRNESGVCVHNESGVCVRNSVCNKPITKRMSAKRRSEGLVLERAGAGKRETVGVHACLRSTDEQEVGDGKLRGDERDATRANANSSLSSPYASLRAWISRWTWCASVSLVVDSRCRHVGSTGGDDMLLPIGSVGP